MKCIFLLIVGILFLEGCSDDKNLYNPSQEEDKEELDLTKTFELRYTKNMVISARDAMGNPRKTMFRVYTDNPYSETGERIEGINPVFAFATDDSGKANVVFKVDAASKTLYVVPGTSAVGVMQSVPTNDYMSLVFEGKSQEEKVSRADVTRAETDLTTFDRAKEGVQLGNGVFNLYAPYSPEEFYLNASGKGERTQFNINSPVAGSLADYDPVSDEMDYMAQTMYPERVNVKDLSLLDKCSDLVVTDKNGANVWVTYLGDYGFAQNEHNILAYYTYKEGETLTFEDFIRKENGKRLTLLFGNTNSTQTLQGTRVQLLYYDEQKGAYTSVFPKGSRIGFAFMRDAFLFGKGGPLAPASYERLKENTYTDQSRVPSNTRSIFFSTPSCNRTGKANGIARRADEYNCCFFGMDARFFDDPSKHNDRDFNDVLIKVTSNPVKGMTPENDIPTYDEGEKETSDYHTEVKGNDPVYPDEYIYGTLAFEDQWPQQGDYDFNDVVVDYSYGVAKNLDRVTGVRLVFTPRAVGGRNHNGFGIRLPVSASVTSADFIEKEQDGLTVILFNDAHNIFPDLSGHPEYVNTDKDNSVFYSGKTFIVNIKFDLQTVKVSDFKTEAFNPFIFVNTRAHEIHLVDKAPTNLADRALFGTEADRSDLSKGIYYRMDNYYPWAIDIPRTSEDSPTWRFPYEKCKVTSAYTKFILWANDWYDWTKPGYADVSLLKNTSVPEK